MVVTAAPAESVSGRVELFTAGGAPSWRALADLSAPPGSARAGGAAVLPFALRAFPLQPGAGSLLDGLPTAETASRRAAVSRANIVIGGIVISQTRRTSAPCAHNRRFAAIETLCLADGPLSTSPFGLDPTFLPSSALFDPAANASALYRADELTATGFPFGFFPGPDPARFEVVVEVQASRARALRILRYLEDGGFLDHHTRSVAVQMVVFNAAISAFSSLEATFAFELAGEITPTSTVSTIGVQPYDSRADAARAVLEVIFVIAFVRTVWGDVEDVLVARSAGRMWEYVLSLPQLVDVGGFCLTAVEIVYWGAFAFQVQKRLALPYSWDVYVAPLRSGRPLEAHLGSVADLNAQFARVKRFSNLGDIYIVLHGLNGGFMLCRLMRLAHFQPRLGLVTRTLAAAASDMVRMCHPSFHSSICLPSVGVLRVMRGPASLHRTPLTLCLPASAQPRRHRGTTF